MWLGNEHQLGRWTSKLFDIQRPTTRPRWQLDDKPLLNHIKFMEIIAAVETRLIW